MSIAPLSLITRPIESPNKALKHHDSLIFSITSQKFDSRKETLLLDESKQLKKSAQDMIVKDYFKIQDKIKMLEEKVESIKTQYCQSESKQLCYQKQNYANVINLEFPEEIYERRFSIDENSIGKIKRKKQKYYLGVQKKIQSMSNSKNASSILTTKRNPKPTTNVDEFSVYNKRKSFFRKNTTFHSNRSQKSRNQSLSKSKEHIQLKDQTNTEIRDLRKQLLKNRLSTQKLSRKSKQSEQRLSISKDHEKRLKIDNKILQNEINSLKTKLKKSQNIKKRQKQTITKQKQQIEQLKTILQEFTRRKNKDQQQDRIPPINAKMLR